MPLHCPNISAAPITTMGCQQRLPLSVVQLKGKHCQKTHCHNGVVDTFRHDLLESRNEVKISYFKNKLS